MEVPLKLIFFFKKTKVYFLKNSTIRQKTMTPMYTFLFSLKDNFLWTQKPDCFIFLLVSLTAAAKSTASVVSESVRPHRWQPTRLRRPWDSPGKNTGVGCHFLLQCMKVKSESEVAQSHPTLRDAMDCSLSGSSIHGVFQARVLEWVAITFSGSLN